jgi:hypothetical protein
VAPLPDPWSLPAFEDGALPLPGDPAGSLPCFGGVGSRGAEGSRLECEPGAGSRPAGRPLGFPRPEPDLPEPGLDAVG